MKTSDALIVLSVFVQYVTIVLMGSDKQTCRAHSNQPQQYIWRLLSDVTTMTDLPCFIARLKHSADVVRGVNDSCHTPEVWSVCLSETITKLCGQFNIWGNNIDHNSIYNCQFTIRAPPHLLVQLVFHYFHLEMIALALRATVFNSTSMTCRKFNHLMVVSNLINTKNIILQIQKASLFIYCGYLSPFTLTLNHHVALINVKIVYASFRDHILFNHQVVWPPAHAQIRPPQDLFLVWDSWYLETHSGFNLCYTCIISSCFEGRSWSNFLLSVVPLYKVKLSLSAAISPLQTYLSVYDGPSQQPYDLKNLHE